jgi:hypothetical protein
MLHQSEEAMERSRFTIASSSLPFAERVRTAGEVIHAAGIKPQ